MHHAKAVLLATILMLVLGAVPHALAAEEQASLSLGEDDKLVYTPDERGNRIPDFSRAGYKGGGVKIPDVSVKLTLEPRPGMVRELAEYDPENPEAAGEGDDTERIQAAINKVSAMPLDENGFRGAVLLKRGLYRVAESSRIEASGVVLRGEGQAKDGTVLFLTSDEKVPLILPQGNRKLTEVPDSRREIADAYVPWGVTSFNLKSADGLAVGDKVVVFRPSTEQWLKDLGMLNTWKWEKDPHAFDFYFEREITAVHDNRITLDVPTVNAMEDKYGGGFVYKYTEQGTISQVGVEHLRLVSADKAAQIGVNFRRCTNSWVRNVTGVNLLRNLVNIGLGADGSHDCEDADCKFITVQDCAYLHPPERKGSKSAYIFDNAQFCLMQRCYTGGGRHIHSCSARVQGPNVYLDMVSNHGWDSGPHHRWSMGVLYDNVMSYYMVARNRGSMGSGHGWAGAQIVFWNVWVQKSAVQQPPTGRNYVFGPAYFKYGRKLTGNPVEPRSLYLRQLEERLGKEAVENVTTEAQRKAVTDPTSELARDRILWDPIRFGIGEVPREDKPPRESRQEKLYNGYNWTGRF